MKPNSHGFTHGSEQNTKPAPLELVFLLVTRNTLPLASFNS